MERDTLELRLLDLKRRFFEVQERARPVCTALRLRPDGATPVGRYNVACFEARVAAARAGLALSLLDENLLLASKNDARLTALTNQALARCQAEGALRGLHLRVGDMGQALNELLPVLRHFGRFPRLEALFGPLSQRVAAQREAYRALVARYELQLYTFHVALVRVATLVECMEVRVRKPVSQSVLPGPRFLLARSHTDQTEPYAPLDDASEEVRPCATFDQDWARFEAELAEEAADRTTMRHDAGPPPVSAPRRPVPRLAACPDTPVQRPR